MVQMQKQSDLFSTEGFLGLHSITRMLWYTKHNFAPQLYSPGIAAILGKAKIDELKARLFIMMIIERKEAEIRHLPALTTTLQETYTASMAKEVENDSQCFVTQFTEAFLAQDSA